MWLYGSGFPKSMDIEKSINKRDGVEFISKPASGVGFMNTNDDGYHNTINQLEQVGESSLRAKRWQGWGTALKPSFEPIIVARKPFKGSLVDNVIKYGVGGINIDECRVGFNGDKWKNQKSGTTAKAFNLNEQQRKAGTGVLAGYECQANDNGRFPANTILTYDDTDFDEVCGEFPITNKESTSRYFYCAKASKKDRDEGLESFDNEKVNDGRNTPIDNAFQRGETLRKNIHPTVKPTELMQYLIRLVTPKGGIILDPFMGSGSTGKATMYENKERNANYSFIGIEKEKEYCDIAKARIEYANNLVEEKEEIEQLSFEKIQNYNLEE